MLFSCLCVLHVLFCSKRGRRLAGFSDWQAAWVCLLRDIWLVVENDTDTEGRNSRFLFLQSPHWAACLQHVRSSGRALPRAIHVQHIGRLSHAACCELPGRRDRSAMKLDTVGIAFILALFHRLKLDSLSLSLAPPSPSLFQSPSVCVCVCVCVSLSHLLTHSLARCQWDPVNCLARHEQTTIFRLRTGHCGLRARQKRTGIMDSALCDCKEEEQTVHHILQDCPIWRRQRHQLWPQDESTT